MNENNGIDLNKDISFSINKYPKTSFQGHLTKNKQFKISLDFDKNKKGVFNLVNDTIKSTFVDKFNKRPKKTDKILKTYITSRLPSFKKVSEDDFK